MTAARGPRRPVHHPGRHFRLVTLATGTSRIAGYLRDTLNAKLFGAGMVSDSYFMAVRIPSLLRDLFAEGALSNAFVPSLSARLEKGRERDAWELMSQVFTLLCLITGAITALGILFAPQVVWVIAHGFLGDLDKYELTIRLTRILFPVLTFVSLAALWMGALNSMHRFTAAAFAPVFMNLTQIAMGLALLKFWPASTPQEEVRNVQLWAVSMTLGMLLQWLSQVPDGLKSGIRLRWAWPPRHPGLREMWKLLAPAIVSQSVLQVNLLVNQFFASFLATGYVTYLYYGNRLFQLPYGVLGISIATITFPMLARQSSGGRMGEFSRTLDRALSTSFFLMVPCTIGIWIVAEPACRLAFEYGKFTHEATQLSAEATVLYALGLVGYTGAKILQPAFYARRDAQYPLKASLAAMGSNFVLNAAAFFFVQDNHWRFWGLALASVLGAFVNFGLLLLGTAKRSIRLDGEYQLREGAKVLVATLVMGTAAWAALRAVVSIDLPSHRLFDFLVPVLAGGIVYLTLAKLLRMDGLAWIRGNRNGSDRGAKA
ncbi:MAG TPA: murein biosynthesis integral membrane protein MurJ [bacterium]|nr:murein biosynthesis integral membrane protein MurJ [bacterium]